MSDVLKKSSESLASEIPSMNKITEMSREVLAKKLGIKIEELPDRKFFKVVDEQLDKLAHLDPSAKAKALKETLSNIRAQEIADNITELPKKGLNSVKESGEKVIDATKNLNTEAIAATLTATTDTLKNEMGKSGTDVLKAMGTIAGATSAAGAADGINGLSKAIDGMSGLVSSASKAIGDMLSLFMKTFHLDGLWESIKGFFGGSTEKKEDSTKKKVEEGVDAAKKEGADLLKKGEKALETKIDKEKIVSDLTTSLGNLIGEKYFGKGVELSKEQLDKIKTIIGKNLDVTTLEKMRAQYMKDGTTRMGDVVNVNMDLMAKLPAGTFFDIALSGIIPTHKIIYNTVVEPSKNLIQLTFDGLPFVDMQMSMTDWSGLLSERAKKGDSHALDLARVQLYAVNGLLWKTMGLVTSGVAAGGIALLTDTVTGVNGFRMLGNGLSWNFDSLSRDIGTIESTLSGGTSPKNGSLGVLSDRLKGLQHNYLMLDLALKGNEDPSKMMNLLKDDSKYLSLKQNMKMADLELSVGNKEIFQRKMAGYLMSPDVTRDIGSATKIAWNKGIGGSEGSIRHYMETTDDLLAKQKSMFLAGNIRNVLGTPLLALKNMKMARSADSVLLHIDDAKDVSKLRAFLAVIPGGLKGLAEFIPATSIVFSIGSIAMDNKNEKGGVYESMMDVAKTVFVPAYGSVSMLMDKTVNIKSIISEGKMPPFGDMALTGVIGGVAVFETVRVANQVAIGSSMMYHGALGQGAKTIAMAPFRGISDIVNAAGSAVRGVQNVRALASTPVANPAVTKTLTNLATKVPKKGRFAIGALALMAAGGAYAYASGPEKPEDIMKNLHKDGWLDIGNNPTTKMKEAFQSKNPTEKKNIIDELLIMHLGATKDLPKTHFDEKIGKYTLIAEGNFTGNNLIDSLFRNTLQSLGVDIDLQKA